MNTYTVQMLEITDLRVSVEAESEAEAQELAADLYLEDRSRFQSLTIECDYIDAERRA